jgi:hypothetical protein
MRERNSAIVIPLREGVGMIVTQTRIVLDEDDAG